MPHPLQIYPAAWGQTLHAVGKFGLTVVGRKSYALTTKPGRGILTSSSPKSLVSSVCEWRLRQNVGGVEGTSRPDRETGHSGEVVLYECELVGKTIVSR